jgi:hypothetical protein
MVHLFDAAIFAIFIVILLQVSRPQPLRTQDVKVWTDDVERRLLR